MSFDTAAGRVAEQLLASPHVEVLGHHDADGVAAASILCHALHRAGIGFRLKIRSRITSDDLPGEGPVVLCDFGSTLETLPESVLVVDHHVPRFSGSYHVNPRLHGIDGDRDLSASGTAYFVARHMGENRDLSGLALLGMIGDGQSCTGKNEEICSDAMAHGFISPHRGWLLPGREPVERLVLALSPYLNGISGNEAAAAALIGGCNYKNDGDLACLISGIILAAAPDLPARSLEALYGDTFELEREIVHDAHTLAALVDACGQAGYGGLAVALCLRSHESLEEAWNVTRAYRLGVVEGIRSVQRHGETLPLYEVKDASVIRGVADVLAAGHTWETPLAVIARDGNRFKVSIRCPTPCATSADDLARLIADRCGGHGGGHRTRAGVIIGTDALEQFKSVFSEAIAA